MSQVARNLENRYNAAIPKGQVIKPVHYVSGFTFPGMPVVLNETGLMIRIYHWGLIPSWARDSDQALQMRTMTLNARAESVFEKPSFRKPIISQRCLVSSDGFFEWQLEGNRKIPWFIRTKKEEIFSFGGIWDQWITSEGEKWNTFSIVTTEANPMMAEIHNSKKRMPLILLPEDEKRWLHPGLTAAEVQSLLKPFPESELEAWTIGNLITTKGVNHDTPEIKKPFSWPPSSDGARLFH